MNRRDFFKRAGAGAAIQVAAVAGAMIPASAAHAWDVRLAASRAQSVNFAADIDRYRAEVAGYNLALERQGRRAELMVESLRATGNTGAALAAGAMTALGS